jgi:phospholipid/cholesterol/gamma-HCH transport system substrate-binding protein
MLPTIVTRQLIGFAVVSLLAMALLGVRYLEIPEGFGVGRFAVTVPLADASGLYENAPVTFRGVQVGKVSDVRLTSAGTVATLSLKDDSAVPASVRVQVRDGSVIGEPFMDLVTSPGDSGGPDLRDGDTIPGDRVTLPVSTGSFLTRVRELVSSIPTDDLRTTLHESATALQDAGALPSIIDSSTSLIDTASQNERATFNLIENSEKVLDTQDDLHRKIRSSVRDLATFSDALDDGDDELRRVLKKGGPAAAEAIVLIRALSSSLPAATQDLADFGKVLNVYQPSLKHLLIVFPGTLEAQATVQKYYPDQDYGESGLSFKLTVNNPPVCYTGFPEAFHQRNPEDLSPRPLPPNSYCKVAHADPRIVRGARNMPCPQDPDKRGARAQDCGLVFNPKELGE